MTEPSYEQLVETDRRARKIIEEVGNYLERTQGRATLSGILQFLQPGFLDREGISYDHHARQKAWEITIKAIEQETRNSSTGGRG